MASRRLDVGQGAIAWLFAASLLLGNACSGDGDVSFGAPPDANGGDGNSAGSKLSSSGSGTGASASGGSGTNGGNSQSGSANTAGTGTAGTSDAGSGNGGTGTAGSGAGGKGNAGNGAGGKGNAGSGAGGKGNAGSGNGGMAGASGMAGSANGGAGGAAGNGGAAGMSGGGGTGGNSDCVSASFGGHSYYFCGAVDSAAAAVTKCQSLNMLPVTIESLAENTFVLGKQKGASWLGGTDALKEGEWRWAPSTTVFWNGGPKGALPPPDGTVDGVFSSFALGQPNNMNVDGFPENCLATSATGWNDLYCNLSSVRAACEGAGSVLPNL